MEQKSAAFNSNFSEVKSQVKQHKSIAVNSNL